MKGGILIIMSLLGTLAKREYREIELCWEEKQWMRCYHMWQKLQSHNNRKLQKSSVCRLPKSLLLKMTRSFFWAWCGHVQLSCQKKNKTAKQKPTGYRNRDSFHPGQFVVFSQWTRGVTALTFPGAKRLVSTVTLLSQTLRQWRQTVAHDASQTNSAHYTLCHTSRL